jgi:hypothetical protein
MKINKLIAIVIAVLLVASVLVLFLVARPRKQPTTATPRLVADIDVPVGDDVVTQIKKGTTIYTENVPAFVLKGTGAFTADFSATVKVTTVQNTRTIRGEITSLTNIIGQDPEHIVVVLYLCQPLSTKAEKFSDGTVIYGVYGGNGYPKIITGQSYDVFGILQNPWQDYPYVYIPTALQFKQTAGENGFDSASSALVKVPIDSQKMPALQAEVDDGHRVGELDPEQVDYEFLEQYLNIPGSTVSNVQDEKQPNGQHNITMSLQDGRKIQLVLVQPVRTGPTGIWCVLKYRIVQ